MVVDDEKLICDMLEEAFSKAGYIVRTAESAEQAIEILKKESIMVVYLNQRAFIVSQILLIGFKSGEY
jgi:DNA-binding NtrC family response regulator